MRVWIFLCCLSSAIWAESAAGLHWTAPTGWKSEQSARPMRAATYYIAPASGDRDPAECAVYFFGPGQGGSVQANLDRWKAQVHGSGGKPADAKIVKRTIHGLAVTTIDASGEYSGMGGPMAPQTTMKAGYRLVGAIVESPGGNIFIKFTGPAATVGLNLPRFEQFLNSFTRQ